MTVIQNRLQGLCILFQHILLVRAERDLKMPPIEELHDFEGHPFMVEHGLALFELMRSIENEGVLFLILCFILYISMIK